MKVFWWQGGLHLEPESDVEVKAMLVLLNNLHYERPPKPSGPIDVAHATTDGRLGSVERGSDLDL